MKKRNLLSLSALVLSLGLVVTSCATQGAEGPKGPQGEQGPEGPKGEAGQPGKTYIDVITRDWNWKEGTVKQDKWAVEAGKNETVTFTFTPNDEKAEMVVVDVKVNDVVVADVVEPNEKGELVFTLKVDDTYQSVQLTAATFTTVDGYVDILLKDYYATLVEADSQLYHVAEDGEDAPVAGQWFASSKSVYDEVGKQSKAIKDEVKKLDKEATASEKIAKIKELIPASETKIKEAYDKALTKVKEDAIKGLEDLQKGVKSKYFKDDDKATIFTEGKDAINAATSIAQITTLVNKVEDTENGLNKGTYDVLYPAKQAAFTLVEGALETVLKAQPELKDGKGDTYDKLVADLAIWDVTVDALPNTIAQEYFDQISAAKTMEVYAEDSAKDSELTYKKGQPVLGVTGADAVSKSLDNIKETLITNIRASYNEEIDASKAITSTEGKNNLKGLVQNTIDSWIDANDSEKVAAADKADLNDYMSYKDGGLVFKIEEALAGTSGNTAFQTERLNSILATVKADMQKLADAEKADADYKALISYKENDDDTFTVTGNIGNTVNDVEYTVPNFAWDGLKGVDKDGKPATGDKIESYVATGLKAVTVTDVEIEGDTETKTTYSVDDWMDKLFPEEGRAKDLKNLLENEEDERPDILKVRGWQDDHKTDFKKIHEAARDQYKTQQETVGVAKDIIGTNSPAELKEIKDGWTAMFNGTTEYNMDTISDAVVGVTTAENFLFNGETGLVTRFEEKVRDWTSSDNYYATKVLYTGEELNDTVSSVAKDYEDLKTSIIGGKVTQEDIDDFIDGLDDAYEADVASYKEKATKALTEAVQNVITGGDPAIVGKVEASRDAALEALGNAELYSSKLNTYDGLTATSVHEWYVDSLVAVRKAGGSDSWFDENEDLKGEAADNWGVGDVGFSYTEVIQLLEHRLAQISRVEAHDRLGNDVFDAVRAAFARTNFIDGSDASATIKDEATVTLTGMDLSNLDLNGEVTYTEASKQSKIKYAIKDATDVEELVEDVLTLKAHVLENAEVIEATVPSSPVKLNGTTESFENADDFSAKNKTVTIDGVKYNATVFSGSSATMTKAQYKAWNGGNDADYDSSAKDNRYVAITVPTIEGVKTVETGWFKTIPTNLGSGLTQHTGDDKDYSYWVIRVDDNAAEQKVFVAQYKDEAGKVLATFIFDLSDVEFTVAA